MTAQIGIFNKKAIALASDSAVTVNNKGREKILNSADKLFELIPGRPVGIMIYNNAEFMRIPYEVIIKRYRKTKGNIKFDTLKEYRDDFLEFLEKIAIEENDERAIIMDIVEGYLQKIIDNALQEIEIIQSDKAITKTEIDDILHGEAKKYKEFLITEGIHSNFTDVYEMSLLNKYDQDINLYLEHDTNIDNAEIRQDIVEVLKLALCSNDYSNNYTGVVVVGYGERDWFPKTCENIIEFKIGNKIKQVEKTGVDITIEQPATLKAYAQSDMAETFIEGINPYIRLKMDNMIKEYLFNLDQHYKSIKEQYCVENNILLQDMVESENQLEVIRGLGAALYNRFDELLTQYQNEISNPFIAVVGSLDKGELAELSESLVNLTSLKRKVSLESESVGGPVDVAIITKGEGFIWIKRKHYFDIDKNPFYNERKRRELYEDLL